MKWIDGENARGIWKGYELVLLNAEGVPVAAVRYHMNGEFVARTLALKWAIPALGGPATVMCDTFPSSILKFLRIMDIDVEPVVKRRRFGDTYVDSQPKAALRDVSDVDLSAIDSDDPLAYALGREDARRGLPMRTARGCGRGAKISPEYRRGYEEAK